MDLVFKRYSSPFDLLDYLIVTDKFNDFVIEIVKIENEEYLWQYFLHKVHGKSFNDFKESINDMKMSKEEIKNTIENSYKIINDFIPKEVSK